MLTGKILFVLVIIHGARKDVLQAGKLGDLHRVESKKHIFNTFLWKHWGQFTIRAESMHQRTVK